MLKIIMISDVYLPRINGVSTSILTFRKALQALGCEVLLIAPEYPQPHPDDDQVVRIPSRYLFIDPEDRMMQYSKVVQLYPRLRDWQPHLLHIHTPFVAHYAGLKLARKLQIPLVETYHTFFEEYLFHYVNFAPKPWLRWAARHYSRSQCRQINRLIVPSNAMLEALRAYGISAPASILPTGIDLEKFSGGDGARFRHKYAIPPQRPTLVYVGRVAYEKNICFLLEVIQLVKNTSHPDILLVIAGEGPALGQLRKQAELLDLKENVLFIGYSKTHQDLMDCYCAGDVFVFASRTETQGLVLLEAMSLGVAVVAMAVMGTKDILQAEQGALVAQENPADFAAKVQQLLGDPALRQRLAQEGKNYVRHNWLAETMAKRMTEVYNSLVCNRL